MKLCWAVIEELRWQTISVVYFILANFYVQKGRNSREKMIQNFLQICSSTQYVLCNYRVSWNYVERLQRSCADSSIFYFGRISKFKRGVTPKEKLNQNVLQIFASIQSVINNYKVSRNLLIGCWGVALTKETGLTDGSKTLYPPQLVASGMYCNNYRERLFILS